MLDSERFKKNVKRWASITHTKPSLILDADTRHLSWTKTALDEPNLEAEGVFKTIPLHSPEGARDEAEKWVKGLNLRSDKIIYVYGIGLGYYYDAVKEWLKGDLERLLVFLEKDPGVLHHLFQTEKGEEILNDNQVLVYWYGGVSEGRDPLLERLAAMYVFSEFQVTALNSYAEKDPQAVANIDKTLAFFRHGNLGAATESLNFGKGFFLNFYSNMLYLPESYLGNGLKDRFKGVPAIVCGAGPSLGKNLDVLATLKDKALILAGGTSMNGLNTAGLLPHFGVGIDPNWHHYLRLITNTAYEVPFLYRSRMFHPAFRAIHGDKVYVCGSVPYEITKVFEEKFGIKEEAITEGFNVINFSVEIAKMLGCNPIILVGVDLAYTDDKSYIDNLVSHPLHDRKKDFRTKEVTDELVVRTDVNGQPVHTLWKWVNESFWYTNFVQTNPQMALINSTEGGLGFPGIPNIPLAFVAEHILKNNYDLETRIQGELQNVRMPSDVTFKKVLDSIAELRVSMLNCKAICDTLRSEYLRILVQLDEGRETPPNYVTDTILENVAKLDDELAYSKILIFFDEKYVQSFGQTLRHLESEDNPDRAQEVARQKLILNIGRFTFLSANIQDHVNMMDANVRMQYQDAEKTEQLVRHPKEKIPTPQEDPAEVYSLKEGMLKIVDPELGLSISRKFAPLMAAEATPDPSQEFVGNKDKEGNRQGQYLLRYPEGHVKLESYYKDGLLHGPTTFFDIDGKVLGKKWFVDGKMEGKARYYYADGSLKSLQRFRDGVWEGKQEYFYPNGQVKTTLHYKKGKLNGDVWLYYPDGQLERELHFKEGKRNGHEKNWTPAGRLVIDVEWEMDKHTGVARSWYENGNQAKEVTYNDKHVAEKTLQWDIDGTPWNDSKYQQKDDYFELVTKQTNLLADSFDKLVNQVKNLAPLIAPKADDAAAKGVQKEIARLAEEMEKLRDINKQLIEASGANDENQDETIWKSPSQRKEIQKQLEEVTAQMGGQIQQMQQVLAGAFGKLMADAMKGADLKEPPKGK